MQTVEVTCTKACNKLKRARPYPYDLNIYRGCLHGCRYCYALYSHEYFEGLKPGSFFKNIIVKTNVAEQLEKQFSSPSWKGEVVNIGSVTDSYQPIEADYRIMPEILKIFIKFKNPCIISTKSTLILRDIDLIDRLSRVAHVNIACTITAFDEEIRRKLEPGAATSAERFNVIKEFSKTGASRGVHIMPIVPYLTDDFRNLDAIYAGAAEAGANYVLPSSLNLNGPTRGAFFDFVQREYPEHFVQTVELFQGQQSAEKRRNYKRILYSRIDELRDKYQLYSNYMDYAGIKKQETLRQVTFF